MVVLNYNENTTDAEINDVPKVLFILPLHNQLYIQLHS